MHSIFIESAKKGDKSLGLFYGWLGSVREYNLKMSVQKKK
jgi:hypothetical protein